MFDEKHFFVFNGGDGDFDHITISRDLFEDGIAVSVKAGTTLPFDKGRQEAVSLQLAKMGVIAPLDLYKDLHMDRIQQRYDNWYKYKTDPKELARDSMDNTDQSEAYVAYIDIMAGKEAPTKIDPSREYILSLRKLMISDDFMEADKKRQKALMKFVDKMVTSLEIRTALDQMSEDPANLNTSVPIQPPQPPMQPGMPMQGQPMPGQMPPAQPPMMPQGMPPSGPGQPPQGGLLGSMQPQMQPPMMQQPMQSNVPQGLGEGLQNAPVPSGLPVA